VTNGLYHSRERCSHCLNNVGNAVPIGTVAENDLDMMISLPCVTFTKSVEALKESHAITVSMPALEIWRPPEDLSEAPPPGHHRPRI